MKAHLPYLAGLAACQETVEASVACLLEQLPSLLHRQVPSGQWQDRRRPLYHLLLKLILIASICGSETLVCFSSQNSHQTLPKVRSEAKPQV
jgi:hypothetical protein